MLGSTPVPSNSTLKYRYLLCVYCTLKYYLSTACGIVLPYGIGMFYFKVLLLKVLQVLASIDSTAVPYVRVGRRCRFCGLLVRPPEALHGVSSVVDSELALPVGTSFVVLRIRLHRVFGDVQTVSFGRGAPPMRVFDRSISITPAQFGARVSLCLS